MATIIKYKWSFSELQIVITFEPLNRFKKTKHHCKYLQKIWSLMCTLRYFNTFFKDILTHFQKMSDPPTVLARKPHLEKNSVYSNKFFHNFHLFESSFTCPRLPASGFSMKTAFTAKLSKQSILFLFNTVK
jgi:hypothetical protein